jgi:hypothetical protein
MDKYTKIAGWLLLVIGIGLIIWTLNSSYDIFTGGKNMPEIFSVSNVNLNGSQASGIEAQLEDIISSQLQGMIPADSIPKILNLICWSVLAFIFIYGGTQIASIGIKLIKQ